MISVISVIIVGLDVHQTIILNCGSLSTINILPSPIESIEDVTTNQHATIENFNYDNSSSSNNFRQEIVPLQTLETLNDNDSDNIYGTQELSIDEYMVNGNEINYFLFF